MLGDVRGGKARENASKDGSSILQWRNAVESLRMKLPLEETHSQCVIAQHLQNCMII